MSSRFTVTQSFIQVSSPKFDVKSKLSGYFGGRRPYVTVLIYI